MSFSTLMLPSEFENDFLHMLPRVLPPEISAIAICSTVRCTLSQGRESMLTCRSSACALDVCAVLKGVAGLHITQTLLCGIS